MRHVDHCFRKAVLKRLEAFGHGIFYLTLRIAGQPGAYALLVPVVLTYVSASRRIHRLTSPYLRRRFPKHNLIERWWDTFRICHSFGQILVDRAWLGLNRSARLHGSLDGWDTILGLIEQGKGLVLLTAHVGNWQAALAHLKDLPVPVHALMHYEEEVSSPGESHPQALSEPGVSLSAHRAPIIQPSVLHPFASAEIAGVAFWQLVPASIPLSGDVVSTS